MIGCNRRRPGGGRCPGKTRPVRPRKKTGAKAVAFFCCTKCVRWGKEVSQSGHRFSCEWAPGPRGLHELVRFCELFIPLRCGSNCDLRCAASAVVYVIAALQQLSQG